MSQPEDAIRGYGRSSTRAPLGSGPRATSHAPQAEIPGKRTLTELIVPAAVSTDGAGPVQRAPAAAEQPGERDEVAIRAAAARGCATDASPLPHVDRLQRLFGRHDISSVQAHTGPAAAASARAMGATAYATGNHVVLGEGSDLHTVAHEAAHVVQQRGGIQLKGGVGEDGDAYERQANEVADLVVRGESAEGRLDGGGLDAPRGPATGASPVQRSNRKQDMPGLDGDNRKRKRQSSNRAGPPTNSQKLSKDHHPGHGGELENDEIQDEQKGEKEEKATNSDQRKTVTNAPKTRNHNKQKKVRQKRRQSRATRTNYTRWQRRSIASIPSPSR